MYQTQAEGSQAAGDWDAALSARQAAIKLDPENEALAEALEKQRLTKDRQAQDLPDPGRGSSGIRRLGRCDHRQAGCPEY